MFITYYIIILYYYYIHILLIGTICFLYTFKYECNQNLYNFVKKFVEFLIPTYLKRIRSEK